jgi:hypothetical protein
MLRFHDVLDLNPDGTVEAAGPREATDDIVDLCAWVFQRGDHDAAATEMTHQAPDGHHLLLGEGELEILADTWKLRLGQVGRDATLGPGDAFAVAVAMFKENGKQRVVWWGHPVKLKLAGSAGS